MARNGHTADGERRQAKSDVLRASAAKNVGSSRKLRTVSHPGINRSVARALEILIDVSRSEGPQSFVELQQKMKLPKASLHKLLLTLETLGFLRRDAESGRYSMGWSTYELAGSAHRPGDILNYVSPIMRSLVAKYNETGHIGVLEGTDEIVIERIDPPSQVVQLAIGRRHPAYATSGGLASLAARGDSALAALPDRLAPRTPNTVKTRKALLARLEEVRHVGYAFDNEEAYLGVRCVGVAIDVPGWPVTSLSFSIPLQRATLEQLRALAGPLVAAAREVEAKLMGSRRA